MKKQDLAIVVILFALMLAWPTIYRRLMPPEPLAHDEQPNAELESSIPLQPGELSVKDVPAVDLEIDRVEPISPSQTFLLSNDFLKIEFSSAGACVLSAELHDYRSEVDPLSNPVLFDFSSDPSLCYASLPGFSASDEFNVTSHSERMLLLERANEDGTSFKRLIELGEGYEVRVTDTFSNKGAEPRAIGDHALRLGLMSEAGSQSRGAGQRNIGIDTLHSAAREGVKHWSSHLPKFFKAVKKERNLARLPETITVSTNTPLDWIATKDKFFAQILEPDSESIGYAMRADRLVLPDETSGSSAGPKNAEIKKVSAALTLPGFTLDPSEEYVRTTSYYVGPKKLAILRALGLNKDRIMEFGWWSPVCKILLRVLNATYSIIPNYGIAILLLTFFIRIVFWPLTHKSTESMRKMQALQPEMAKIKEKYKNNPKLMQAETMALYKQHKVNPMSGCLPMLIQIPVFIALFVVLRSAIELRFASFLWIKDLSQPEGLFANVLPIPLNILPILMAVTMAWQQRLTPTSDPSQQKMMSVFMPVMMLVMFYNMPSALVLYWTASQCTMIGQQLIQKKRRAKPLAQGSS